MEQSILLEVYGDVEAACLHMGVEVYLIGANARDVHFAARHISPPRVSFDVDLALKMPYGPIFEALRGVLSKSGFRLIKWPLGLIHIKTEVKVDLMPFEGAIDDRVVSLGSRLGEVSVAGMKSVLGHAEAQFVGGKEIKVVSLAGLVALKLIAHSERPEMRKKDLVDVKAIIKHYFDFHEERAYASRYATEMIPYPNTYEQDLGAALLGEDMAALFIDDPNSMQVCIGIVEDELSQAPGPITAYWLSIIQWPPFDESGTERSEEAFSSIESIHRVFGWLRAGMRQ